MKNCLKCKELDTSDIPNLFCKISCELVNETEFRYCPKNPKSVVEFIEKLEEIHKKEIQELRKQTCEKIRTFIISYNSLIYGFIDESAICNFLNQIERGE